MFGVKTITEVEAYKLYLQEDYDQILPFKSKIEPDFVEYLESRGLHVISEDDIIDFSYPRINPWDCESNPIAE